MSRDPNISHNHRIASSSQLDVIHYARYLSCPLLFIIREDLDIFLMLRLKFPAVFGWLVWFACGRRKCLICGEPETISGKQYGCNTIGCVYIHCEQCWIDVGVCYACSDTFTKEDNEHNLDVDTATAKGYVDTDYQEYKFNITFH